MNPFEIVAFAKGKLHLACLWEPPIPRYGMEAQLVQILNWFVFNSNSKAWNWVSQTHNYSYLLTFVFCVVSLDEPTKEDLLQRRLWEKSNLESYMVEMRKESKRRR